MNLRPLRWPPALPLLARCAVMCAVLCTVAGCGAQRFIIIGTASAPSTSGYVEIEHVDKHEVAIKVRMEQLHPAERLDAAFSSYVVWLQGESGNPVRAGSLRYDADARAGELRTKTPFRKFVVKVTAEANDKPSAPSHFMVASQEVLVAD